MPRPSITSLLPCYSLDDFPRSLADAPADEVLWAWTLPWHPAVLVAAGVPQWSAAASPPPGGLDAVFLLPSAAADRLPETWRGDSEAAGAKIIALGGENDALAEILSLVGADPRQGEATLVDDFFALAFAYLHMELLARRMRYMSNIDAARLEDRALEAAAAWAAGDAEGARAGLNGCYDVLSEARDLFYCVGGYLLDYLLVAPETLGAGLDRELANDRPRNVFASGRTVERLAAQNPAGLARLKELVAAERVCLVGGEYDEIEAPLAPLETVLWQLLRGRRAYEQHLDVPCEVFGRRRFGLTPVLPQVLYKLGYASAAHVTLDDGRFPLANQCHSRWEGVDGTAVDALFRVPQDAALDGTLLCFADNLGTAMDFDHVATVAFAHWPDRSSRWFELLKRIPDFQAIFGEFVGLKSYVRRAEIPGYLASFPPDEYASPYLQQDVAAGRFDPISRFVDHRQMRSRLDSAAAMSALAALVQAPGAAAPSDGDRTETLDAVENWFAAGAAGEQAEALDRRSRQVQAAAAAELAQAMGVAGAEEGSGGAATFNPWGRDAAAAPAWGFGVGAAAPAKGRFLADDELILRGTDLDVVVHPATGGVQAVRSRRRRGNRMSQQLALRDESLADGYSRMVADYVGGSMLGGRAAVESVGRLVGDDDQVMASYRQVVGFGEVGDVVVIDIEVEPQVELSDDPWRSHFACRFSWGDSTVDWRRSVGGAALTTHGERLEAPDFVLFASDATTDAVLTGGLPYHVRVNPRMLDSLLSVRGERRRRYRLGISIDSADPFAEAQALLAGGLPAIPATLSGGEPEAAWLFRLDRPGAATTHWELLRDEGRCVGLRIRILDTLGMHGPIRLEAARAFSSARLVDFLGTTIGDATVAGGAVCFDLGRYEWTCVEARWD